MPLCRPLRGRLPARPIARSDGDGFLVGPDQPIAIRALKRFACERHGVEARPPEEALEAVRAHLPEVSADAEELAALLRATAAGGVRPADGEPVAVVGAGCADLAAATTWRC